MSSRHAKTKKHYKDINTYKQKKYYKDNHDIPKQRNITKTV